MDKKRIRVTSTHDIAECYIQERARIILKLLEETLTNIEVHVEANWSQASLSFRVGHMKGDTTKSHITSLHFKVLAKLYCSRKLEWFSKLSRESFGSICKEQQGERFVSMHRLHDFPCLSMVL